MIRESLFYTMFLNDSFFYNLLNCLHIEFDFLVHTISANYNFEFI